MLVQNERYILTLDDEKKGKPKTKQNSVYFFGKVFNDEKQLEMHPTDNPNHFDNCNLCYRRTLPFPSIHSSHKYVCKFKWPYSYVCPT